MKQDNENCEPEVDTTCLLFKVRVRLYRYLLFKSFPLLITEKYIKFKKVTSNLEKSDFRDMTL